TGNNVDNVPSGSGTVVLEAHMKTSSTEDLVLQLTMECSIITQVTTTGTDSSTAFGQIRAWITIDGGTSPTTNVVPVSTQPTTDDGKVVFCNRAHTQTFTDSGMPDDTLTTYLRTRDANAFNWVKLNAGGAGTIHDIKVWADFTNSGTTSNALASGLV